MVLSGRLPSFLYQKQNVLFGEKKTRVLASKFSILKPSSFINFSNVSMVGAGRLLSSCNCSPSTKIVFEFCSKLAINAISIESETDWRIELSVFCSELSTKFITFGTKVYPTRARIKELSAISAVLKPDCLFCEDWMRFIDITLVPTAVSFVFLGGKFSELSLRSSYITVA